MSPSSPAPAKPTSGVEAITSRIAHIAVLDARYVAVVLSNIDRARTAQQLSADALTEHRI